MHVIKAYRAAWELPAVKREVAAWLFWGPVFWVAAFFLSLLFTSPLRFFTFLWQLLLHGLLGRSVPLQDRTLFEAWLVVANTLVWIVGTRHHDDCQRFFRLGVRKGDGMLELPRIKAKNCFQSCGKCVGHAVRGFGLAFGCWLTAPIPVVGTLVALGVQFFLLRKSLNVKWAAGLTGLSFVSSHMLGHNPRLAVYLLVSSKSLGLAFFGSVFSRLADDKARSRALAAHTTHLLLFGAAANVLLSLPLIGGALFWAVQSAAGFYYADKFASLFATAGGRPALRFGFVERATAEHVELIDQAYRRRPGFGQSWTGEGHLVEGRRISLEGLEKLLRQPEVRMVECRTADGGRLLGSVELSWQADKRSVMMGLLNVDPHMQGRGIGRRMVEQAERIVKQVWPEARRIDIWVLERRFELIDWYKRMGFEQVPGETAPFPTVEEGAGQPTKQALEEYGGALRFAILHKSLQR